MATKWAEGRPRFESARGSRPVYSHRRFFDGVMCKANASFSPADCVKFMSALLEFDDYLDMLYRLTNPRVSKSSSGVGLV
ncbi:hypothetical protein HaLaN_05607 [Haematococcus lacustris]|uniref:Uncharacterized protein n=1 Tax=Haematococcus lacustris TaxID=44745 RepID=A0A699YTN0_HAELA|nr:hypothetical protein HaLaN_05607 [Haematococcus lacustris]